MPEPKNLLARPTYGMEQVDRILRLPLGTARRWIDGYTRDRKLYPPVVRVEPTGDDVVTWGEFTEARLLSEFRDAGVPMVRMRPAVQRLRELFDQQYPLARARPWLDNKGRELVLTMQKEVGLHPALQFVVVRNDQLVWTDALSNFVRSVEFDDLDVVQRMHPAPELRRVVLDPLRQFGIPVVRSVPTEVIAEQMRAGEPIDRIAEMFDLERDDVEQAVAYELIRSKEPQAA